MALTRKLPNELQDIILDCLLSNGLFSLIKTSKELNERSEFALISRSVATSDSRFLFKRLNASHPYRYRNKDLFDELISLADLATSANGKIRALLYLYCLRMSFFQNYLHGNVDLHQAIQKRAHYCMKRTILDNVAAIYSCEPDNPFNIIKFFDDLKTKLLFGLSLPDIMGMLPNQIQEQMVEYLLFPTIQYDKISMICKVFSCEERYSTSEYFVKVLSAPHREELKRELINLFRVPLEERKYYSYKGVTVFLYYLHALLGESQSLEVLPLLYEAVDYNGKIKYLEKIFNPIFKTLTMEKIHSQLNNLRNEFLNSGGDEKSAQLSKIAHLMTFLSVPDFLECLTNLNRLHRLNYRVEKNLSSKYHFINFLYPYFLKHSQHADIKSAAIASIKIYYSLINPNETPMLLVGKLAQLFLPDFDDSQKHEILFETADRLVNACTLMTRDEGPLEVIQTLEFFSPYLLPQDSSSLGSRLKILFNGMPDNIYIYLLEHFASQLDSAEVLSCVNRWLEQEPLLEKNKAPMKLFSKILRHEEFFHDKLQHVEDKQVLARLTELICQHGQPLSPWSAELLLERVESILDLEDLTIFNDKKSIMTVFQQVSKESIEAFLMKSFRWKLRRPVDDQEFYTTALLAGLFDIYITLESDSFKLDKMLFEYCDHLNLNFLAEDDLFAWVPFRENQIKRDCFKLSALAEIFDILPLYGKEKLLEGCLNAILINHTTDIAFQYLSLFKEPGSVEMIVRHLEDIPLLVMETESIRNNIKNYLSLHYAPLEALSVVEENNLSL